MMKNVYCFRFIRIFPVLLLLNLPLSAVLAQDSYTLTPVSGADGVFTTVTIDEYTVYRSIAYNDGSYALYMYFQCDENIRNSTVYLEVTYLDYGYGNFNVHYNSTTQDYDYAREGHGRYHMNTGKVRTAVFKLSNADFRNAQNLQSDLRLNCGGSIQLHIISAILYPDPTPLYLSYDEDWISPYSGPPYTGDNLVDATAFTGKVICGYQGWFRCAGDPTDWGWVHYGSGDFSHLSVDMWPDMLEFPAEEKYPVPGWTLPDGSQAYLFSSANKRTVLRHFQWMEAYGIDGVAVQRFTSGLSMDNPKESFRIPGYARDAANRTGRTFYIMYDISGMSGSYLLNLMRDDWDYLVHTMKITEDDRYLHHDGKPVVGIFGFFSDRFSAAFGNQILDLFQEEGSLQAFVAGSGMWPWATQSGEWLDVFHRMDAYIPWNIGNYEGAYASTYRWAAEKADMASHGCIYVPLVYPGFSWDNMHEYAPGTSKKPRLQGLFLWNQFLDAKEINARTVYVAMFDEIDEGTAIFKVSDNPPVNHYFIGLEGLPSDFYLLLTGYATRMMRGNVDVPNDMPDFTSRSQPSIPDILSPVYDEQVVNDVTITWNSSKHFSEITGYELELDDQVTDCADTLCTTQLSEGVHMIRVRATNAPGNKSGWSLPVAFHVVQELDTSMIREVTLPGHYYLAQNHPNPFNSETSIEMELPVSGPVTLTIYDVSGRVVRVPVREIKSSGRHIIYFDSRDLPTGIYFYRLEAGSFVQTRKMVLLK